MATINMPPKKEVDEEAPSKGQARPVFHRYRLQVDRQTKASYEDKSIAEKAGKQIKKAYPVVHVTIYDAETEEQTTLSA